MTDPPGAELGNAAPTPPTAPGPARRRRVLLITGMSGAGKTSALKAVEDLGYEAVDHVPISLLSRLITADEPTASIAVGVDVRTRDFGVERFLAEFDRLTEEADIRPELLFLDCHDDELRRRYTATRHRHPLATDRPVSDGIALERRMILPLRTRADLVLDTTSIHLGDLKRLLAGHFGFAKTQPLGVFVTSFSFRLGLPREADLVFDVRFLANPYYEPALRPLTGRDPAVMAHIAADPGVEPFFSALTNLLAPLLPRYADEGKSYLTIAIGCTGGRHRSVFVAERLAGWLRGQPVTVHVAHRDLELCEPKPAERERGQAFE